MVGRLSDNKNENSLHEAQLLSLLDSRKELLAEVGRWYDVCQLASDQLLLTGGSKRCGVKVDCWLLNLVNKTWT